MGLPVPSYAQLVGEVVIKRGTVDDDLYIAGGQVDLYATVNGDVIVGPVVPFSDDLADVYVKTLADRSGSVKMGVSYE